MKVFCEVRNCIEFAVVKAEGRSLCQQHAREQAERLAAKETYESDADYNEEGVQL